MMSQRPRPSLALALIVAALILASILSCGGDEGGPTENKWRWIEEIPPGISSMTFDAQGGLILAAGGPRFGSRQLFRWRDGALKLAEPSASFGHSDLSLYRARGQVYAISATSNRVMQLQSDEALVSTSLDYPQDSALKGLIAVTADKLLVADMSVPDALDQAELAYWRPDAPAWTRIPGSRHFAQAPSSYQLSLSPEGKIVLMDNGQGDLNLKILVGDLGGMKQLDHPFFEHESWSLSMLAGAPDGSAYLLRPGRQVFPGTQSRLFHITLDGQLREVAKLPEPHRRPVGLSVTPSGVVFAFAVEDNSPSAAAIYRYTPADGSLDLVKEPQGHHAYWRYIAYDADTIYMFGSASGPSDGSGVWRLDL